MGKSNFGNVLDLIHSGLGVAQSRNSRQYFPISVAGLMREIGSRHMWHTRLLFSARFSTYLRVPSRFSPIMLTMLSGRQSAVEASSDENSRTLILTTLPDEFCGMRTADPT